MDGPPITAGRAEKTYICPGCSTAVLPGIAHLVVWSEDHLFGAAAGLAERRHWHSNCWTSRELPVRTGGQRAPAIAKLAGMSFDPASYVFTRPLPHCHPRLNRPAGPPRERRTAHVGRAQAGGRAGRPGNRPSQGNTHHAASAADARRLHGLARLPQGVLPAARPRRNRRAALQHPRHHVAAGNQRGSLRGGRRRASRRRGRGAVRRGPRPAKPLAGGLVLRHRTGPDVRRPSPWPRKSRGRCCSRPRCTGPRTST